MAALRWRDAAAMSDVEIRDARGPGTWWPAARCLPSRCASATARRPAPWLVQTAASSGGIALGAFCEATLIGISVAIPAEPDALFSCGLAVDPGAPRQGRRAPAQARPARTCACDRPHGDPLDGGAVVRHGARALPLRVGRTTRRLRRRALVDVRPSDLPQDDVTIEWAAHRCAARDWAVRCVGGGAVRPSGQLAAGELGDWRLRVRRAMSRALERGNIGTGVALDRASRRAWVLFSEPGP